MQELNVKCLPENYPFKYYYYHFIIWPELIFVAENTISKKVVGYVMGKIDDEKEKATTGHVTSLAVHWSYRKLGIASKLMQMLHVQLREVYQLEEVSLNVRESNHAALFLYNNVLKYKTEKLDIEYYQDKENAFLMKKDIQ